MNASDRYIQKLTKALPEAAPQRDRFLKDMALSLDENCIGNSYTSFLSFCKRFGSPSKAAEEYLVGMGADDLATRVRSSRHRRRCKIVSAAFFATIFVFLLLIIVKSASTDSGNITRVITDYGVLNIP